MAGDFRISWHDSGQEPKEKPNPKFPFGVDIDASKGASATCTALLPYPARRCGYYRVACHVCGQTALVTTAGRPDDPRSLKLACRWADGQIDDD